MTENEKLLKEIELLLIRLQIQYEGGQNEILTASADERQ